MLPGTTQDGIFVLMKTLQRTVAVNNLRVATKMRYTLEKKQFRISCKRQLIFLETVSSSLTLTKTGAILPLNVIRMSEIQKLESLCERRGIENDSVSFIGPFEQL